MARTAKLTPGNLMFRSLIWSVISAAWLILAWLRVQTLASKGRYVSPLHYGAVIFWAAVLLFWIVNAIRDSKRMRVEAAEKVS